MQRCYWERMTTLLAIGICIFYAIEARAQVNLGQLRTWGLETYGQIDSTLRVSGSQLFAETASLGGGQSGGFNGRAFVWPEATQFRVFDALAKIQPATYTPPSGNSQINCSTPTGTTAIAPARAAAIASTMTTATSSSPSPKPSASPMTTST